MGGQIRYAMIALFLVTMAHLLHHAQSALLGPLFPLIRNDIGLTYWEIGFLTAVAMLSVVVGQIVTGNLVDRFGAKIILLFSLLIPVLGFVLVAIAYSFTILIYGQLVIGIGLSAYHPAGFAIVRENFADDKRGKAMAIHSAGGTAGVALIPFLATYLAYTLSGWRMSIFTLVLLNVIAAIIIVPLLRKPSYENETQLSPEIKKDSYPLSLFVIYTLVTCSRFTTIRILDIFTTLYVTDSFHVEVLIAATLLSLLMIIGVVSTFIGGHITDKIGRKSILILSNTLTVPFLLIMVFVQAIEQFFIALILLGFMLFLGCAADSAYLTDIAPQRRQGSTFGLIFSIQMILAGITAFLFGWIADLFGLRASILILVLLMIIGSLAAMNLKVIYKSMKRL